MSSNQHNGLVLEATMASTTVEAIPTNGHLPPAREMSDSIGCVRRFVKAFVTRTQRGEGGLAELAMLAEVETQLRASIDAIALHLLAEDASYREIGAALGITLQAAHKRYPGASARQAGGQPSWLR